MHFLLLLNLKCWPNQNLLGLTLLPIHNTHLHRPDIFLKVSVLFYDKNSSLFYPFRDNCRIFFFDEQIEQWSKSPTKTSSSISSQLVSPLAELVVIPVLTQVCLSYVSE